jgi:hypothetical protein
MSVRVRLYANRLDVDHIREAEVRCEANGKLYLDRVQEQLGLNQKCRVS